MIMIFMVCAECLPGRCCGCKEILKQVQDDEPWEVIQRSIYSASCWPKCVSVLVPSFYSINRWIAFAQYRAQKNL